MLLKEIIKEIEIFASPTLQENYDNAGLIFGFPDMDIQSALLTLDCTERVVDEAIELGSNLIIAHHPIIFKGIKTLTGRNYVERTLLKAIQNNIAIYAAHTNLDNKARGVNYKISRKLGLHNLSVLQPKNNLIKLVTFVPLAQLDIVRDAIFKAGAGAIGDYNECGFSVEGKGTFKAGENTSPFVGKKGKRHQEKEERLETILPSYLINTVLSALKKTHPYEEPAFDFYEVLQDAEQYGSGMLGELPQAVDTMTFLKDLKEKMNVSVIRHTDLINKKIKRVALCGGAGSFLLKNAIKEKADIYISADFKYHEFFDAENKIIIADIGHYESEHFTPEIFNELLNKKFINFATHLSKTNTNPINYL